MHTLRAQKFHLLSALFAIFVRQSSMAYNCTPLPPPSENQGDVLGNDEFRRSLRQFIDKHEIKVPNFDKLENCLLELGCTRMEDLVDVEENDLQKGKSSLFPIHQRKFLNIAHSQFGRIPITTYGSSRQGNAFDVGNQTISIRYLFCHNMYVTEVREQAIMDLDPQAQLALLHHLIQKKEKLNQDMMLEFYSHEGYPFNANQFSLKSTLSQWKLKHNSLLYVFVRPKKQLTWKDSTSFQGNDPHDSSDGHTTLVVKSAAYESFTVTADLDNDDGTAVIHKVAEHIHVPDSLIELDMLEERTIRGKPSLQGIVKEGDVLYMRFTKFCTLYDGTEGQHFGRCTYNPSFADQTDSGYATFYSILYFLTRLDSFNDPGLPTTDEIVAYIHKEYFCPPMTYALKVLLQERSLNQPGCWVALVEGLYQLFKAIVCTFCEVEDDHIFEFSHCVWGMIFAKAKGMAITGPVEAVKIQLHCPLTNVRMVEPVYINDGVECYEKQSVLQKLADNEAVEGFSGPIEDGQMQVSDIHERILMYTYFNGDEEALTWVATKEHYSQCKEVVLGVISLNCTWQELDRAEQKLKIIHPQNIRENRTCLTYLERGCMGVFVEFGKSGNGELTVYNPLYDPTKSNAERNVKKEDMAEYAHSVPVFALTNYLTAKARSAVPRHPSNPTQSTSEKTSTLLYSPEEAIMIVLDASNSMRSPIFAETEAKSRLAAAKLFYQAFIQRTEAYKFKHIIGLVTFSSNVDVTLSLTTDFNQLREALEAVKTKRGTKLYDAIYEAAKTLISHRPKFHDCKRRILCLTDGLDTRSKQKPHTLVPFLQGEQITVDTVVIHPDGNITQKAISHATGGFCFFPRTEVEALKVFEIETCIRLSERKQPKIPKWEGLSPFSFSSLEFHRSCINKMYRIEPWDEARHVNCWLLNHRTPVLLGRLDLFLDESKYPYNTCDPYGKEDVSSNFTQEMESKNFTSLSMTIYHASLMGVETHTIPTESKKRVFRELRLYQGNPHPSVEIFPCEENIAFWKMLMRAPEHTPYQHGIFHLMAKFPKEYPRKPPEIRFITPIYHCNINSNGRICHSILDRNYVPSITMRQIINYIYGLLQSPEPLDPLDSVLAEEYLTQRGEYEEKARELVAKFANKPWDEMVKVCIGDNDKALPAHTCPLTRRIFVDPVITEHGHTYEKEALLHYLAQNNNMDPIAKKHVDPDRLIPNLQERKTIEALRPGMKSLLK